MVYAELDPIPESFSRGLVEAIPDGQFQFLPGTNHFVFIETPDLFFPPVREFLHSGR